MATLTPLQIILLARKKLLEDSTAIFDDESLLQYANLSKDEIAKRLFSNDLLVAGSIAFASGVAAVPDDFESHYMSKDSQQPGEGNTYNFVDLEDFRNKAHDRMLCRIGSSLYVYPSTVSLLYTDYYKKLDDMTSGGTCPLDSSLQELLVYGILYRAFEDLQDFDLSKYYRDKFELEFGVKGQTISFSEEQPQEGGSMFNGIKII